jgi:transcriptional regulator GlxA family with amidase domain
LTKTNLTLQAVAERAGFGSHQEYLGAVLKKHLGKTPAQIRSESR